MDPPEIPPSWKARRENQIQLQGPRPNPLKVSKDSYTIKKPPKPQVTHSYYQAPPHQPPQAGPTNPVIIYSLSPKPIHVDSSNFMSLVQRLTGRDSPQGTTATSPTSAFPFSGEGPVSPAARLAAMERAGNSEWERRKAVVEDVLEVGHVPGILSPAPANLLEMPAGLFTPTAADGAALFDDSDWMMMMNMMSPMMMNTNNNFMPSPSALLFSSGGFVSPAISPGGELFNIFDFSS